MHRQRIHLFYTGSEFKLSRIPFLLDAEMRPLTAANAWLRKVSQDGSTPSPHTRRTYAYHLFDFFNYLTAHGVEWDRLDSGTLIQYRDVQDQNTSPHTKKPLNRKTINARLFTLGKFYSFAHESGFIDKNPVIYKSIKVRRPADTDMLTHISTGQSLDVPLATYERLSKTPIKWRPHDEVMEWLNSIQVWRDKLVAKLLYRTGMRRDEVVNLKIENLPRRNEADRSALEISFNITGKGRKIRTVYLPVRDFIELHDYLAIGRAPLLRRAKAKHDFIFVGCGGKPLTPSCLNAIFKRVSDRCGINITPHMLRHSFAVVALRHWRVIGVARPDKLLQARLGHASLATTQVYMHMTDEDKAEEAYANASLIELLLSGEASERK